MTRRKDARLIAMELRNWMNKKEYLVEDVNRGLVVLVNGLLGKGVGDGCVNMVGRNLHRAMELQNTEKSKGNGRVDGRSCNLGHPVKPPVQTSVIIDDEHCQS